MGFSLTPVDIAENALHSSRDIVVAPNSSYTLDSVGLTAPLLKR
jgi:hypothetical protein